METITHRELRNSSAEVLRRVENGETLQVSNHGRSVAVISPATGDVLDGLIARGEARAALTGLSELARIKRVASSRSTSELIRDARTPW